MWALWPCSGDSNPELLWDPQTWENRRVDSILMSCHSIGPYFSLTVINNKLGYCFLIFAKVAKGICRPPSGSNTDGWLEPRSTGQDTQSVGWWKPVTTSFPRFCLSLIFHMIKGCRESSIQTVWSSQTVVLLVCVLASSYFSLPCRYRIYIFLSRRCAQILVYGIAYSVYIAFMVVISYWHTRIEQQVNIIQA